MVDLFGHAGLLDEVVKLMESIEIELNAIIWRTLPSACKMHANVKLGRTANEQLLKLRQDESGDYMLLSNMYAPNGEWRGAENVRKLMDDSRMRKSLRLA
ncbi:Hypothetical predicted protein [Olea europaea subsp. europaea]|uniref:Pentatricopeptide repeat-containing protein n=1 Tax=Olea europaea subsp. europaea TaxID=158383 RepID=A0A8S0PRQ8_OLEEU|nr:Hypothetical predicted protein [Olea europaea subsp. europaea]